MTGSNISFLLGKTLSSVFNENRERIIFTLDTGEQYALYHTQDCCESVWVEDIAGDLKDLIGSPILKAEESTSNEMPPDAAERYKPDSCTWTFYQLATARGYVTIRFYGESNGYYSESVEFGPIDSAL